MKQIFADVILSAAKNLKLAEDQEGEILSAAKNDMGTRSGRNELRRYAVSYVMALADSC